MMGLHRTQVLGELFCGFPTVFIAFLSGEDWELVCDMAESEWHTWSWKSWK